MSPPNVLGRPLDDQQYFRLPGPFKLSGPEANVLHPHVFMIAGVGQHLGYNVEVQPGLTMTLTDLPGRPRWYIMFQEDPEGWHIFCEANTTGAVIKDLWQLIDYMLSHCRRLGRAPAPLMPGTS